jgi:Trk-type K+ transport system membrane component
MDKQLKYLKPEFVFTLFTSLITAATAAFLAAYFVNSNWSQDFERYKNKASFEKEATAYGFELSKELFFKAAKVYQNTAHYRGVELLPDTIPTAYKTLFKNLQAIDRQYPKVGSQDIFNFHNEFQIQLMASKPYIPDELFEQLSHFATTGATVIFNMAPSKNQYDLYTEYGKHFDKSVTIFRTTYNLSGLESSVLMLNNAASAPP